jgi:hypothetical protein
MQAHSTIPDGAGYRSAVDILAQMVEEAYRLDPVGTLEEGLRIELADAGAMILDEDDEQSAIELVADRLDCDPRALKRIR